MKKILLFLGIVIFFYGNTYAQQVHITKSGKKYHSAGCSSLSKSDFVVSLDEAIGKGLTPCSKCDPPAYQEKATSKSSSSYNSSNETKKTTSNTYSGRCQATTKKGKQCSRSASDGSNYCWQHK